MTINLQMKIIIFMSNGKMSIVDFEHKLDAMKIAEVDNYLENLSRHKASVNLEHIDDVVNKIKHILIEPAHDLKMIKREKGTTLKKNTSKHSLMMNVNRNRHFSIKLGAMIGKIQIIFKTKLNAKRRSRYIEKLSKNAIEFSTLL